MMRLLFPILAAGLLLLTGCMAPDNGNRAERLRADILVFQSDPAIVDFLVEEALCAGVRSIRPMQPRGSYPDGRPRIQ